MSSSEWTRINLFHLLSTFTIYLNTSLSPNINHPLFMHNTSLTFSTIFSLKLLSLLFMLLCTPSNKPTSSLLPTHITFGTSLFSLQNRHNTLQKTSLRPPSILSKTTTNRRPYMKMKLTSSFNYTTPTPSFSHRPYFSIAPHNDHHPSIFRPSLPLIL